MEMPNCTDYPYPCMADISISLDGIESLLRSIDVKKATGPDGIPAWSYFKTLCNRNSYMQFLAVIFNQSLSEPPPDWLIADITPFFKKRDR